MQDRLRRMFIVSYIMACLRSSAKIGYIGIQIAYVTLGEGGTGLTERNSNLNNKNEQLKDWTMHIK